MIKIKHLSLNLQGKQILSGISADIPANYITAILGPNGAGKSSFLKCLTGGTNNYSGVIEFEANNLRHIGLKELSRRRAVLSQQFHVAFPFTVYEIVEMGRTPFHRSDDRGEGGEIIEDALRCVDALHLKKRLFSTLSGGEQQRVQLARVLAQLWGRQGACLFLDEPTSALDLRHQLHILTVLRSLCQERKFTVVVILHDLNLARSFTDHALVLKQGKLYSSGPSSTSISPEMAGDVYGVAMRYIVDPDTKSRNLFYVNT